MATEITNAQANAGMLDNEALAARLEIIALTPRFFKRAYRDAYANEAAKRLRWPDIYQKHLSRYQRGA